MKNIQYIKLSNDVLKDKELSANDIGVYLAIGKYMNGKTKIAFPSQATIVKDTNLSLQTVRSCIKRLQEHNAFEVKKKGKLNTYQFSKDERFESFDMHFLKNEELSTSIKGYLAKLQPHMFKDNDNNEGIIKYTYAELKDVTGLSVPTLMKNDRILENKKYAIIELDKKIYHLDRIGQYVLCKLEEHDEEIKELQDRVRKGELEQRRIEKELYELKQKINNNKQEIVL